MIHNNMCTTVDKTNMFAENRDNFGEYHLNICNFIVLEFMTRFFFVVLHSTHFYSHLKFVSKIINFEELYFIKLFDKIF